MKKRIAFAIDSLTGGGAEKIVLTLAAEFVKLGHEVHILVMHNERLHSIPEGILIHSCFGLPLSKLVSIFRIKKTVSELKQKIDQLESQYGKFDIFYSNLNITNQLMAQAEVQPLYCVIHAPVEEELSREKKLGPIAYLKLLRSLNALNNKNIICVSNGVSEEIKLKKRIHPATITTIYNPYNLDVVRNLSEQNNNTIPDIDYIIHVGRFAKSKRHDVLFNALKKVKEPVKLVLLCKNTKKAIRGAKKYGVLDRVIIPGFQQNPYPWIKHAKALILSSDYEGFGNVLIESLAVGTPVVSTDCPYGPSEILTGNLSKYLVPLDNAQVMAQKIDEVLQNPPNIIDAEILTKVKSREIAKQYLSII